MLTDCELKKVRDVIDGVMGYLDSTLSPMTTVAYRTSFKKLESYYCDIGISEYSPDISRQFLDKKTAELEHESISRDVWLRINRSIVMANQYFEQGNVTLGTRLAFCSPTLPALTDTNSELLNAYASHMRDRGLRETSIAKETYDAALFLRFMQDEGIPDPQHLTTGNTVKCIPYLRKHRQNIGDTVASVRRFLTFLSDYEGLDGRIPKVLHVSSMQHKKIIYGFTNDEAERVIAAADRTTAIGKRDYAIMLLAHETGLRCYDIKNLKVSDIKWRDAEIHLVTSKGKKPHIIRMVKGVGDALADYKLNGRPDAECPYMFLSTKSPHDKLYGHLNSMVKKYAHISGVDKETKACIGMHAFRRGLGASMLDAKVPLSVISEVLDHSRQNTTKRYLAIDIGGLGMCAMPMEKYGGEVI